jgi:hypothetical protein
MPENRTRDRALTELRRLLPTVRSEFADTAPTALLTEKLLEEVFAIAWAHQFDEDRSRVSGSFKQVVREAIAGVNEDKPQ